MKLDTMSPRQVVAALDKYIVGQSEAKRAVAIALANRVRRLKLDERMQKEVKPKNLLMIGPTGVGKTEIARRLAVISDAPFIKVEATKYTEVGYVGRDVESMVRDLVENAIRLVKQQKQEEVKEEALSNAIDRIAKVMKPGKKIKKESKMNFPKGDMGGLAEFLSQMAPQMNQENQEEEEITDEIAKTRKQIKDQIRDGKLDNHEITIQLNEKKLQMTNLNPAMEQMMDLSENLTSLQPKKKIERNVTVKEALKLLTEEESEKLVNLADIHQMALELAESKGIIFIDEMDKIASKNDNNGHVSRQGVQRDILPIVEGSQIQTKYGIINTDHILFIGSGAFHVSKPSDLIPELQGRFPIRVNLNDLNKDDFIRILTEPTNAITKQYQALLATDGVEIKFDDTAINAMAEYAVRLNEQADNIGARRLHTIIETVLEDLLFEATDMTMGDITINETFVNNKLAKIVEDKDLSHYIL